MSEVNGINLNARSPQLGIDQAANTAKSMNITEEGQAVIRSVLSLLASERSVRVTNHPVNAQGETGTVNGPTGTPALDNPNDTVAQEVDLEKLMFFLQLENSEEQSRLAQDRINIQKDSLGNCHKERMEKLQKTMEKMEKAARANLINKIFGWLLAAVAVVIAVAACVATGGLAVGPVIGAAIAVGSCVLSETGVMDKLTDKIAEGLQKLGLSKEAAKIIAQVVVAIAIMAASLACCGAGAGAALSKTATAAQEIAKSIQQGADIAMKLMGLVSIVSNGVGAGLNYNAGKAQAELTELGKFLAILRQQMMESEEELQAILELIQGIFSDLVAILSSQTDTQKTIAQQMATMA